MLRVSDFLKLTRLMLEQHSAKGQPIPAHSVPDLCNLMRHCEIATATMEVRLAGQAMPTALMPDSNIVSLAAFSEARSKKSLNPTENKD